MVGLWKYARLGEAEGRCAGKLQGLNGAEGGRPFQVCLSKRRGSSTLRLLPTLNTVTSRNTALKQPLDMSAHESCADVGISSTKNPADDAWGKTHGGAYLGLAHEEQSNNFIWLDHMPITCPRRANLSHAAGSRPQAQSPMSPRALNRTRCRTRPSGVAGSFQGPIGRAKYPLTGVLRNAALQLLQCEACVWVRSSKG
jgi:hypothetical protein